MSVALACIGGSSIHRLIQKGRVSAKELPPRSTPWGPSEPVFLVETGAAPYYLMSRYRPGPQRQSPSKVNFRANLYALKDIGVQAVLSWTAAGTISHNLDVGEIVVPEDLIDQTRLRPTTFFERSEGGFLRQFPVFCPGLRRAAAEAARELKLACVARGTVAVVEGPRMETPAEVRMLAAVGAELVTHTLAPDVFLAKELQLCFAGACYLVNFAETGSRHRPFTTGRLFAGDRPSESARLARVTEALPELVERVARLLASAPSGCGCDVAGAAGAEPLGVNWRERFQNPSAQG